MVMKYADNIVKVRHGITALILVRHSLMYFYMHLYNVLQSCLGILLQHSFFNLIYLCDDWGVLVE